MEKFLALSDEKQTLIRNAALSCFSQHGYEKHRLTTLQKWRASLRHPFFNILVQSKTSMNIWLNTAAHK